MNFRPLWISFVASKGLRTQPRDFEHPAIISVPRLKHILAAIEIETQTKGTTTVRRPAFHPEIIEEAATALARGLAEATPDQEVGVRIIRRQAVAGVLNKKYLTSFLAYVDAEHLYLTLRRADWFVARKATEANLPKPRRDYRPMNFRIVSGEPLYYAGPQTLEIDWRNDVFRSAFALPGSTKGTTRRREILLDSPIPVAERQANDSQGGGVSVGDLSAAQLRALADLEDDRPRRCYYGSGLSTSEATATQKTLGVLSDRENGARRCAQRSFGHIAQQQMIQHPMAAASHHNQIRLRVLRVLHDDLAGGSELEMR